MNDITLMDGGLGQELLRRRGGEPTPLWSAEVMLNAPDLVRDLHLEYIQCGARVLTLNTYTATPERLEAQNVPEYLERLHDAACSVAKEAIELSGKQDVTVAACLPPLVASYRPDVAPSFEKSLVTYRELVELQASVADIYLCETMASISEARAATLAAVESGKPTWLALTVSDSQPMLLRSGELLSEALVELAELGAEAILLNCSHPEAIDIALPLMTELGVKIGAYGNGFVTVDALEPGGTVSQLQARKDLGPDDYATHAMNWVGQGATIIGGCCEIGPAHIRALHESLTTVGL